MSLYNPITPQQRAELLARLTCLRTRPLAMRYVAPQGQPVDLDRLIRRGRAPDASAEDCVVLNLVWRCIKRNQPALAAMLTDDPVLKELKEVFPDAGLVIYIP